MNAGRPLLVAVFALQASALFAPSAEALSLLTAPDVLNPGATVSPLQNGDSGVGRKLFNALERFAFTNGPSGILDERVLQYSDTSAAHPYGRGLYFDFEITLSSGDVTKFTVPGYSGLEVSVKQCGISNCGGLGANGVLATSAHRTSDGNDISFSFGNNLSGTAHSANLQLLTNATSFVDPFASFQDSKGNLFSIPVLSPVSAVPLPSTWGMMLLALVGLGFVAFRKKRKAGLQIA